MEASNGRSGSIHDRLYGAIESYPTVAFPFEKVRNVPILYYICYNGFMDLYQMMKSKSFCNMEVHRMNGKEESMTGTTPLWIAISNGHVAIASDLLGIDGVDFSTMFDKRLAPSPLIMACQAGKEEGVNFMLRQLKIEFDNDHGMIRDFLG